MSWSLLGVKGLNQQQSDSSEDKNSCPAGIFNHFLLCLTIRFSKYFGPSTTFITVLFIYLIFSEKLNQKVVYWKH